MRAAVRVSMRRAGRRLIALAAVLMPLSCVAGCWNVSALAVSSAGAVDEVAAQMRVAVDEYHAEIARSDDLRESAAIDAFAERLKRDASDDAAAAAHTATFKAAMDRLRDDRAVETQRHSATLENLEVLAEVNDGLRQTALDSLTLQDEVQRYVGDLIEAHKAAMAANQPADTPEEGAQP